MGFENATPFARRWWWISGRVCRGGQPMMTRMALRRAALIYTHGDPAAVCWVGKCQGSIRHTCAPRWCGEQAIDCKTGPAPCCWDEEAHGVAEWSETWFSALIELGREGRQAPGLLILNPRTLTRLKHESASWWWSAQGHYMGRSILIDEDIPDDFADLRSMPAVVR